MAETAQTMTEFTYAPGEKNIVGDRFSPSVIIFWLKTSREGHCHTLILHGFMPSNGNLSLVPVPESTCFINVRF